MSDVSDSAVATCQAGNLQAFETLYDEYCGRIYAYVYRRTLHRPTAEDITSTVFLRALEKIDTFSNRRGPFSAWLYGIARNALIDHFRSRREHVDIHDAWDLSGDSDPHAETEEHFRAADVRVALATLDPVKREIVLLRIWDGLSYGEIASIVGKSEGNCKVIYSRALDALREKCRPAAFALLLLSPHIV